jgi:hypothetical protein
MRQSGLGLFLLVPFLTLPCGCGSSVANKSGPAYPSDANLATIGRLYARAERKLGRPPNKPDELKPFLAAGDDIDQMLVSPNDGQPYVVVWGTKLASAPDQYVIIAYERAGSKGLRVVLCPSGTRTLADADFAKSTFPPGHTPGG